jgi:hypothetical protein
MATNWKNPPIAKVYEALTALADKRVAVDMPARSATVASSDGMKKYLVTWNEDQTAFGSNDNASYWQGYLGYPIVATLLAIGQVGYSKDVAASLSGVVWKKINDAHKRNYSAAIDEVLEGAVSRGADRQQIESEVQRIATAIGSLTLGRLQSGRPPTQ